jgi:hypothetical protein
MSTKIEHNSVAGLNLEPNKKAGYYLANGEIYYNKFHAFLDASKSNTEVKWVFNEKEFMSFPWHVEPETSLNELYRRRAQQLRDEYDYIRVEASGGSDSTTVVYSFLLNNIPLDEVVFRYPKLGEKNASYNPVDLSCENTLSEWDYATRPLLNWIATNYPKVKITVHDYSKNIVDQTESLDESWIFRTRHYLQPAHAHKHTNLGLVDHKLLADNGYKIAVVYGVDKPKIVIKDNKFFLYFIDSFANHNNNIIEDYNNVTSEFFYWSPDACELLSKQAHIVKNWFSMPQNYNFQSAVRYPNNTFANRNLYERLVKTIIYPDYDPSTFQVNKPTNNVYNEMDFWFHQNFVGTKMYNIWEAGIDYLLDNINDCFVDKNTSKNPYNPTSTERSIDLRVFNSMFYYLGDSSIPDSKIPHTAPNAFSKTVEDNYKKIYHLHCIKGKLVIY